MSFTSTAIDQEIKEILQIFMNNVDINRIDYEHNRPDRYKYFLEKSIVQTKQLLRRVSTEVIGENDAMRSKEDMLEAVYHRLKGKNSLRSEQHKKLNELVGEE